MVKINQNMSIEMHFDGQTACLILVDQIKPFRQLYLYIEFNVIVTIYKTFQWNW